MSLLNPQPEYTNSGDNHAFQTGRCDQCETRAYGVEYWATSAAGWRAPVLHLCVDCVGDTWMAAAIRISKVIDDACDRARQEIVQSHPGDLT